MMSDEILWPVSRKARKTPDEKRHAANEIEKRRAARKAAKQAQRRNRRGK
jgi:hypothetical protein